MNIARPHGVHRMPLRGGAEVCRWAANDLFCKESKMRIGPTELIIISVICCIPAAIATVIGIVFAIVKLTAKSKPNQS
jgi:hypothetical protein